MSVRSDTALTGVASQKNHEQTRIVDVKNLVTQYPGNPEPTLKGVDFEVCKGEIMVIMGGSGSGKSTLLRQLIALDPPTSGTIRLFDQDIMKIGALDLHALRLRMGVAFQGGAMFNSMTVGENLILPLREHLNLANSQMDIMARMKLAFVNLDIATIDKMPSELSGGMLKRAALARAIIMDPPLLFCDEPSAGLDPVVSSAIDDLIIKLRDALEMTIVVVTHERTSAFKIADRITILDRGNILTVGTLDELRSGNNKRVHDLLLGNAEDVDAATWI